MHLRTQTGRHFCVCLLQSSQDCARLTGQSVYTIEVFSPLRNIWNLARNYARAATTAPGVTWLSRHVYHYHRLMLLNLAPREPATQRWPLFLYPPPHFLVGYHYVVKTANDYVFDTRAYSRIRYAEIHGPMQQMMNWSVMANCSYTINTAAYHRFVDLENFQETLEQVQQAVLAERVVADLAIARPLRGFGVTHMGRERNVPVERLLQDYYKNLSQCQSEAWGLADRIRLHQAGQKDLVILRTIKRLKTAFFNFLVSPPAENTKLSLPCDCCWLDAFVDKFTDPELCEFARIQRLPAQTITKCIISALTLPAPNPTPSLLSGGAFELRPREDGRAVTEQMRRRRGEVIERFVDRLPIRRRRRRRRAEPPAAAEEEDREPGEGAVQEPEEPRTFEEEVRETVAQVVRLLEEELTTTARNAQFFNFAVDFYRVIQRLEAMGNINETTVRRWVMYFFVTEHIATTLNYLNHQLRLYPPFARWVELNIAQLVMRARGADGEVVYSRVWNETGLHAFRAVMNRVAVDLAATVERAGVGELEEEELEQFMQDIAFHENSGDIGEIVRQVETNDAQIESIELSFRFKVTGPVVFTQNREIQHINRRVIATASNLHAQALPLPQHNEAVQLLQVPRG
uniref:Preterminal protein n=1 Tax=Cardioderma bat adenovirus TaxID=3141913 RepID=A0AAU7E1F1_9ADEN